MLSNKGFSLYFEVSSGQQQNASFSAINKAFRFPVSLHMSLLLIFAFSFFQ